MGTLADEFTKAPEAPAELTYGDMGLPHEVVLLDGENHYAPDMPAEIEEVPMQDLNLFLNKKFGEAQGRGTLPTTLTHYVSELDKAKCVDAPTLDRFRVLAQAAQDQSKRGDVEGLSATWKSASKLAGSLIIRRK